MDADLFLMVCQVMVMVSSVFRLSIPSFFFFFSIPVLIFPSVSYQFFSSSGAIKNENSNAWDVGGCFLKEISCLAHNECVQLLNHHTTCPPLLPLAKALRAGGISM